MISEFLISKRAGFFSPSDFTLVSPEQVRIWSFGEVRDSRLFHPSTECPFPDGLFCQKIFGPIRDYQCECGKYSNFEYRGRICEGCGVELGESKLRGQRFGHIELASPCINPRFVPWIASILKLNANVVEEVSKYKSYIVKDRKETEFFNLLVLGEDVYLSDYEKYESDLFEVFVGATGIKRLLGGFDINSEIRREREMSESEPTAPDSDRSRERLSVLQHLRSLGAMPQWTVLDALPVIPPALRPAYILSGKNLLCSSINTDYMLLLNRNRRLVRLKQIGAPGIIIDNEARLLQSAVNILVKNISRNIFDLRMSKDGSIIED